MDIKELNKVLAEALTENKPAIKRLHEDYESIDDIANEVAEQIKDEYDVDNEISLDTYISETIDSNGYFSYMDDVIDLYKEIATYETGIYNDLSDAVFSEIKGRVEDLLSDWKEENQIEESVKLKEDAKDFKIGDFVFCRANFRYGFIKDFDGRLYTVDFVCSDNGAEEMAKTDKISIGYFEDGKARLEAQIADLERQLAAKKKIKEKFVK